MRIGITLGLGAATLTTMMLGVASSAHAQEEPMNAAAAVERWTLDSGATVVLVERHDFPFVSFGVTLRSGALWDPADKPGLASVTAKMMTRGAGARDRAAINEDLEVLGSELEVSVGHTALSWDVDVLGRNLEAVVAIVADVIQTPTFPKGELAKLLREKRSDVLRTRDNDRALNRKFFRRALFAAHPEGRPAVGTLTGYEKIGVEDVRAFYADHVRAKNIIFGFSGDVTRTEVDAILARRFDKLEPGAAPDLDLPPLPHLEGRQVLLVDKPARTQNQILIGHLAPAASSSDQYALDVVNTVFGGTFTARLNHEIRDVRGLAYGAYSYLNSDRIAGTYRLFTYPSSEDGMKTLRLILSLYEQLVSDGLTQEELDFAQNYLANSFAFEIDTPERLLTEVIRADLEDRGADYVATYVEHIRAVTLEEANRALGQHLDPNNLLLVMLCVAARFEEAVATLPKVTTVKVVAHDARF